MASRRDSIIPILKVVDLVVVVCAFLAAIGLAFRSPDLASWLRLLEIRISIENAIYFAVYLAAWHYTLRGVGLYISHRLAPAAREVGRIGAAAVIAGAPIYPIGKLMGFSYINSKFLIAFMGLSFLGLTLQRRGLRMVAAMLRRRGINLKNALIIGERATATRFAADLAERGDLGYRILEVLDFAAPRAADGLGEIKHRIDVLSRREGLDEVFVVLPLTDGETTVQEVVALCEAEGITVRVLAHIANLTYAKLVVDEVAGHPVLSVVSGPRDTIQLTIKRAIDVVGAMAGLVFLSPLLIAAAIAVRLDSNGPALFVQERVGHNRRRFNTYKFRTMVHGADGVQHRLEHLNEAHGPVFKIKEDPRITRVGRWLRQTSIDELPQLFNVLIGDMSLVGPRPLPVRDVEKMDVRWHKRRFAVKPGITCLWQANSREPNFDEWIKSDMEYIDRWSLKLDFLILLRTIPAVFTGTGAH
jgi:exopolysaccharide biosynthesis polyprenyl glycosylphosphotransferase